MMYDLVKEAVNDMDAALELSKAKKDVTGVVDAISQLPLDDVLKLGSNFKKFPLGCDITEAVVGTCASDLEEIDLLSNCYLANKLGTPIHICAYAFADIGERFGKTGLEVMQEVYDAVDVPLDLDHFGINGAMRFPRPITACGGDCYNEGPGFKECPRGRIHERLIDKELAQAGDKEEWVKLSSSVAVNVSMQQTGEAHAAPISEAQDTAKLAKKYGKGLETIMFVGDGYDDVITGFEAAMGLGTDVFVIEGGPFNRAKDTTDAYARTIAAARILTPGGVVATNGAYEHECRIGLRAGLNMIITGFPKNHHGYMCGYEPGTARRGKFGLPRILKIIKEEVPSSYDLPIGRNEMLSIARAVKIVGPDKIYPNKIGDFKLGDAHWATMVNAKMYKNLKIKDDVEGIASKVNGSNVGLLGGRFVSWALAQELDKQGIDEITISDIDPWIEKVSVDNLQSCLNANILPAHGNDKAMAEKVDTSIITSTMRPIHDAMLRSVPDAITLF